MTVSAVSSSPAFPQGSTALAASSATGAQAALAVLASQATNGNPREQGQALRALDLVAGSRVAADAVTAAANNNETCSIEVRYKPVVLGADHAFIVTTDGNSTNYFRGGPAANNTGSNSSSGSSGSNPNYEPGFGVYGPIVTEYGAYRPGTVDWTTEPSGAQLVDRIPGNCDRIEGQFARHMDDIERARINYYPLSQNSNSTVRETLERAGYPNVNPVEWVPGWNTQLPPSGQ